MAYQPPPQPKKNSNPPPVKKDNPKKNQGCHYCNVVGHWKRNCPLYLDEMRANRIKKVGHVGASTSVYAVVIHVLEDQGLKCGNNENLCKPLAL
ncbi:hypothetical protein CTI12_AA391370 [Artemisia annua]|uniref:CCHC-type domain-containing protein n=1 Tax=Artemisia annua TaxID=35608 RepID=A0A2U1ME07_ARTAN|nr:hypothetical protein CTI12_AA391370 [Artemisia annua]